MHISKNCYQQNASGKDDHKFLIVISTTPFAELRTGGSTSPGGLGKYIILIQPLPVRAEAGFM